MKVIWKVARLLSLVSITNKRDESSKKSSIPNWSEKPESMTTETELSMIFPNLFLNDHDVDDHTDIEFFDNNRRCLHEEDNLHATHKEHENWSSSIIPLSLETEDHPPTVLVHDGEFGTEYVIRGIKAHELPVIGTYVDKKIIPGFMYSVRRIGSSKKLFGKPRQLESIGRGYAKRITFTGDSLNYNDCYFWADSSPDGFAFSIHTLAPNDRLIFSSSDNGSGELIVNSVDPEQEITSCHVNKEEIIIRVNVSFTGKLAANSSNNEQIVRMKSIVHMHKTRKAFKACIQSVYAHDLDTGNKYIFYI